MFQLLKANPPGLTHLPAFFLLLQLFGKRNLRQCSKVDVQNIFSVKGQIVNISGFLGPTVSVPITQPFCCRVKAATDKRQMAVVVF